MLKCEKNDLILFLQQTTTTTTIITGLAKSLGWDGLLDSVHLCIMLRTRRKHWEWWKCTIIVCWCQCTVIYLVLMNRRMSLSNQTGSSSPDIEYNVCIVMSSPCRKRWAISFGLTILLHNKRTNMPKKHNANLHLLLLFVVDMNF